MFLTLFLLVIVSLDNFIIGISYGARKIKISLSINLLIALITTVGTIIPMMGGKILFTFLKPQAANYIGSLLIIVTGIWVVIQEIAKTTSVNIQQQPVNADESIIKKIGLIFNNPVNADLDFSGHISFKEGVLLGFALALNNAAFGIGAGLIDLNPLFILIALLLISVITISWGFKIGYICARSIQNNAAPLLSGVLLILAGMYDFYR